MHGIFPMVYGILDGGILWSFVAKAMENANGLVGQKKTGNPQDFPWGNHGSLGIFPYKPTQRMGVAIVFKAMALESNLQI